MDLKFKRCGTIHNLQLKIGRYGNGSLAIILMEGWEAYANLTVNLEAYNVVPSYAFSAFVDSESSGFDPVVEFVTNNNLGELTGREIRIGDISFPEILFNKEKLKEFDPDNFEEYEAYSEALKIVRNEEN